jgi:hypothetical protein
MRLTILLISILTLTATTLSAQKPVSKNTAKNTHPQENKVVTGTILLNERTPPDNKAILAALKSDWKIRIDTTHHADKTEVYAIPGATVMIAYLDYPVSPNDIKAVAGVSWLWPKAAEEAIKHQAQVVISIIGLPDKSIELHKTFTKVAAAVLENTASRGVYMGSQYILLSKGFYTSGAHNLLENNTLPLYFWIYFGMSQDKDGSSGYTYGLQEFGLPEMEIVHSSHDIQDVHATLFDAVSYVLPNNKVVQDGETITIREDVKLTAHLSKAVFLTEGKSLKLSSEE